MKRVDPRLQRVERLLAETLRLLGEIKEGVPPPRRKAKQRRRFSFQKILAALAEGASLEARGNLRDRRLPSRTVLAKYRRANPKFDREAGALLKERSRQAARVRRITPTAGATEWAQRLPGRAYDWNLIAEKIEGGASIGPYSANRGDLPSHTLIMARRKADPVFGARVARVLSTRFGIGRRKPIDREDVLERIRCGAVIKANPPAPGMPRKDQIDRLRREDGEFGRAVRDAIAEARRRKRNRRKLSKLGRDAAWDLAQASVPKSLGADQRDDIIAELSLMICAGEVAPDSDLGIAWKRCRTRLTGHRWKEDSLDSPIHGTDGLTRLDLLDDQCVRL